jgi:hypothetical protein
MSILKTEMEGKLVLKSISFTLRIYNCRTRLSGHGSGTVKPRNSGGFSEAAHRANWSQLASQNQGFGSRALRAALDSSPLWGAGRVEDTYNLSGTHGNQVLRLVADQQERELVEVGQEAGASKIVEPSRCLPVRLFEYTRLHSKWQDFLIKQGSGSLLVMNKSLQVDST